MLNGLDPIILFNFFKATPATTAALEKIPVVADIVAKVGLPPIPIYLSESLTGLFIDTEEKSIEIDTKMETLTDGADPKIDQKGLQSTIKVSLTGKKNSLGLTLIAAMSDLILKKVTSKEYSITYLHGATTVFGGLLHSFNISQTAENDLLAITFELSTGAASTQEKSPIPVVGKVTGAVPL